MSRAVAAVINWRAATRRRRPIPRSRHDDVSLGLVTMAGIVFLSVATGVAAIVLGV